MGEFGLGHENEVTKLKEYKYQITKVHPSDQYTIYADDNYKNIWTAGSNYCGECGIGYTHKRKISTLRSIEYFKINKIQISKICVSIAGSVTFFITNDNKLYGCGSNGNSKLGLNCRDIDTCYEPILVQSLENVVHVEPSCNFSIALCQSADKKISLIIQNWCRLFSAPDDIQSLLVIYTKFTKVYSTAYSGHGHGDKYKKQVDFGWKEIEFLSDKNIIKFAVGSNYAIYLAADGTVYGCGNADDGKLGIRNEGYGLILRVPEDENEVKCPVEITYFKQNDIKIVDIATGYSHSLAVDIAGRIYSWGFNGYGECGNGKDNVVNEPVLIETWKDYQIDTIRCGKGLSYCKSKCGALFGEQIVMENV